MFEGWRFYWVNAMPNGPDRVAVMTAAKEKAAVLNAIRRLTA